MAKIQEERLSAVNVQRRTIQDANGRKMGEVDIYPHMVKTAKKQNKGFKYFKNGFVTGALVGALVAGSFSFVAYDKIIKHKEADFNEQLAQYQTVGGDLSKVIALGEDVNAMVMVNYKIQEGDSLWGLASRIYSDQAERNNFIERACRENNIENKDNIRIGTTIHFWVPEDKLEAIGMTEGYSSTKQEYLALKDYVDKNEGALDLLEENKDNQYIRSTYAELVSECERYETQYELAEGFTAKERIARDLVRAYRLRMSIVEGVSHIPYMPSVVETHTAKAK